jgi:hypothetical protein
MKPPNLFPGLCERTIRNQQFAASHAHGFGGTQRFQCLRRDKMLLHAELVVVIKGLLH